MRDHILGRYLDDLDAEVHADHFLDKWNHQHKARALDLLEPSKRKDHGTLIFPQDLYGRRRQDEGRYDEDWRNDV